MQFQQLVYDQYHGATTNLTLDELLTSLKITHQEYRTWLANNNKEMAPPTPGLVTEVVTAAWSKRKSCKKFQLSTTLYDTLMTDPDYTHGMNGDAKAEMRRLRQQGVKAVDIATQFNVTESRVYQVTRGTKGPRKSRQGMTFQDKLTMAHEKRAGTTVDALAKKYQVSVNTIYVYLREIGGITYG